jgi:hypothetical protein
MTSGYFSNSVNNASNTGSQTGVYAYVTKSGAGQSSGLTGVYSYVSNQSSSSGDVRATYSGVVTSGSGLTVGNQYGGYFSSLGWSGANITNNYGIYSRARNFSTATGTKLYGSYSIAENATDPTVPTAYGVYGESANQWVGTVTNSYGGSFTASNSDGVTTNGYGGYFGVTTSSGSTTNGYGIFVGNVQATNKFSLYASDATAPSYFAGSVGIGTASPTQKLDVSGNIKSTGQVFTSSFSISTNSIDWDTGNSGATSDDCASTMNMSNLRDGGTYTLVVTGASTTQCNFNTSVPITGSATETVNYRFRPANSDRYGASHTIYTFTRVGTNVYVSWTSGF